MINSNYYYRRRKKSKFIYYLFAIIIVIVIIFVYFNREYLFKEKEIAPVVNEDKFELNLKPLNGSVYYNLINKDKELINEETKISEQSIIKTENDSRAELNFNGSIIRLEGDSELAILSLDKNDPVFSLNSGQAFFNIKNTQLAIEGLVSKLDINEAIGNFKVDKENNKISLLVASGVISYTKFSGNEIDFNIDLTAGETFSSLQQSGERDELMNFGTIDQVNISEDDWLAYNLEKEDIIDKVESSKYIDLNVEGIDSANKLTWDKYVGDGFLRYRVVRSLTNSDLKYPDDKYIRYSNNLDFIEYIDRNINVSSKYYYRICVEREIDEYEVICSNVVSILNNEFQEEDLSEEESDDPPSPEASEDTEDEEEDTPELDISTLPQKSGSYLGLVASVNGDRIKLAWSSYGNTDFDSYKVLRSTSSSGLGFPGTNPLSQITAQSYTEFLNTTVEPGVTYYYMICTVAESGIYCSGTANATVPVVVQPEPEFPDENPVEEDPDLPVNDNTNSIE